MTRRRLNRRHLLAGVAAAAGAYGLGSVLRTRRAHSEPDPDKKPYFLVNFAAFGGASIIDSFLPIKHSESANFQTTNCFPDYQVKDVSGSPIRAVDLENGSMFGAFATNLSGFANKHKQDMMISTLTGTSVNHAVAQKRALTGNGAYAGRTLAECVAAEYGEGMPVPNVNMSVLGFLENGDDKTLPAYCYHEPVSVPVLWPLGLNGSRGIKIDDGNGGLVGAPNDEYIALARAMRNDELDPESSFYRTFQLSEKLQRWKTQRNETQPQLESADLISKLNMLTEGSKLPFSDYDLASSPDAAAVQEVFPNFLADPLEAQMALAFLLIKYGVSVAVTIGPSFNLVLGGGEQIIINPPLSFDFSHTDHRNGQAFMWQRMLTMLDGLIDLLKGAEFEAGESFWDRTMIQCATDFGRSKNRPNQFSSFGSGHDLNNGVLTISPLVNGNTVLGGVDPDTAMTYGFDPETGAADTGREMTEAEIFAGHVHALGISTSGSGLPDMPAMRKS